MHYPRRIKTRPLLQMESVECGAAALGIVCAYHGKHLPLEQLRYDCGVGRDGTNARNIVQAARTYGLEAKGTKKKAAECLFLPPPFIVFWEYNHFLVVEGADKKRVYLNDPALGRTWVTHEEFQDSYSGVALTFTPAAAFRQESSPFNSYQKVLELMSGSRKAVWFLLFTCLLSLLPAVFIPSITRIFFDYVLIQQHSSWLLPTVAALGVAILASTIIMAVQQDVLRRLQTRLSVILSYNLLTKIFHLPLSFYLQRSKAEISSRTQFANSVAEFITGVLLGTGFSLLSSLAFLVIMILYSVKLSLISLLLSLVSIRLFLFLHARSTTGYNRLVKDRSRLSGISFDGLQAIESIKSTGRESEFFERWAGFHARLLVSGQHIGFYNALGKAFPTLLSIWNMAVILVFGGLEVMEGHMTIGMLVTFIAFYQFFFAPVQKLAESQNELQLLNSYLSSLYDILNYPSATTPAGSSHTRSSKLSGRVEITNLTFGYNRQDKPVLHNLNLTIRPGERVAFIGLSGSGKSTFAKLLAGLYQPWEGAILLDGTPLDQLPPRLRTESIGVVDQEIELFEGTVRDVLTFWDPQVPMEDIMKACRLAEIHDLISERPGGYYSRISEGGKNFSGGQRQRLEIARALIKKPSLLIMDEATSALDPDTEYRIGENIRSLGITTLMIAHRLSTIRDCDQIVVLSEGTIAHIGTHEELVQKSPLYAEFLQQTA